MLKNIIFILSSQLKIFHLEEVHSTITFEDAAFKDCLMSNFIGFYDWLRVKENQICGLRITPFDFAEQEINQIPDYPYLKLLSDNAIEIFFADFTKYLPDISCDQDFGTAKLYKSDSDVYAISVNVENLSLVEQGYLKLLFKENQEH